VSTYGVKLRRSDDLRLDAHAEGCTLDTFEAWCSERTTRGERLAIDLFSGAGGLSLGMEQAGWTVAASVDSDPKALQTHRHNFAGLALPCDLGAPDKVQELIDLLKAVPIDLVAGGPPCQPFSRAGRSKIKSLVEEGRRPADDLRRHLWRSFVTIATSLRPRVVLMENVPDMALGDDFKTIRLIALELERAGYETEINLVDAWKFGVPQHRKRLILLARRDGAPFTWPAEEPAPTRLEDAIKDLPVIDTDNEDIGARSTPYRGKPRSPFAGKMREGMTTPVVWDHMTRPVRKDDREIFELMTPDMLYADVPEHLRRYSAVTFDDKYKKLDWNELCRTITAHIAKDGYWYIHPDQPRTLSVREAARVQTFPDRFRFAGTRSDAFRQIGNAVPPMLGYAAAMALAPTDNSVPDPLPSKWVEIRRTLEEWAEHEQAAERWYLLPGGSMTKPVALLVSLFEGKHGTVPSLRAAAEILRGKDRVTAADLKALGEHLTTPAGIRALDQIRPLARKRLLWEDLEQLCREASLKPAQTQLFRMLCGEDVLMTSQSVLRVAARVAGTDSHRVNRLTDGKVAVARLMGGPSESSRRVAALRLIGSSICQEQRRICESCPLAPHCSSRQDKVDSKQPTLFASLSVTMASS
jgi:DNA (cytosine-5)-methyltransferase 1